MRLLELCFTEDVSRIHIHDRPRVGFRIGESVTGVDTRLSEGLPFWFSVVVEVNEEPTGSPASTEVRSLESRFRSVIDFAKPAHTAYELEWRSIPLNNLAKEQSPIDGKNGR
jgi:hypothetical protein